MAGVAGGVGSGSTQTPLPAGLSPPLGWWAILQRPVTSLVGLRALALQLKAYAANSVTSAGEDAAAAVRKVLTARAGEVVAAAEGGTTFPDEHRTALRTYMVQVGATVPLGLTGQQEAVPPPPLPSTTPTAVTPTKGKLVLHDDDLNAAEKAVQNDTAAFTLASSPAALAEAVAKLQSADVEEQRNAVRLVRKALSTESSPPIEKVLHAGAAAPLVTLLSSQDEELQFEAAWALTNIASGTTVHTTAVVAAGVVPLMIGMVSNKVDRVADQAIWCLGNIAGDTLALRDHLLAAGAASAVAQRVQAADSSLVLRRNGMWTLSNLCRGKVPAPLAVVNCILPVIVKGLVGGDTLTHWDATWAVRYVTQGGETYIQAAMDAGCLPALVPLLVGGTADVLSGAASAVGGLLGGSDEQVTQVLAAGVLEPHRIPALLRHDEQKVRRGASFAVAQLTRRGAAHIQCALDANTIPPLVDMMTRSTHDSENSVQGVTNAMILGTPQQVKDVVGTPHLFQKLASLLRSQNPTHLTASLLGMTRAVQVGASEGGVSWVVQELADHHVTGSLTSLSGHSDGTVANYAKQLLSALEQAGQDSEKLGDDDEGGAGDAPKEGKP